MEYKKIDGIAYNLHMIKTNKFKKNMIKINFKNKLIKEDIVKRRMIPNVLVESNSIYPTKRLLDIKTEDLYNLDVYNEVTLSGNCIVTSFSEVFLNDKYGEKGLLSDSINFLFDLIFKPNIKDNKFDLKAFNLSKTALQEDIESIKEDPRGYSLERFYEEISPDSCLAYHELGYLDDLNKLTSEQLYQYYLYMLHSDIIDIFVIGDIDFNKVEEIIKSDFKINTLKRFKYDHFIEHKKISNKFRVVKDEIDNNQSVLILGYKLDKLTRFEQESVLPVYSYILGGGPDSKLFKNVREKNSLCYSISSSVRTVSNIMIISSGINANDYKKSLELIKQQVADMGKGDFDESDIDKAKTTYSNVCKEILDSMPSIINNYVTHEYLGFNLIEDKVKQISTVTKEDILKVIPKIHPEIVYFLEGTKHEED